MAIQKYKGHLALLGAAIMWGLMSPIGKTALENGISGLSLATFRMTGGAICFWIASIFAPKEQVKPHDLMMLFFAGLLGIVLNQGCFTFGLSLTSPIDASIVTTTAPIATMIVAAIYLKEPVTGIYGLFWITADKHVWKDGQYYCQLTLSYKRTMDEAEAGSLPNRSGSKTASPSQKVSLNLIPYNERLRTYQ